MDFLEGRGSFLSLPHVLVDNLMLAGSMGGLNYLPLLENNLPESLDRCYHACYASGKSNSLAVLKRLTAWSHRTGGKVLFY